MWRFGCCGVLVVDSVVDNYREHRVRIDRFSMATEPLQDNRGRITEGATGYGTEALQVSACTARTDHDRYQ
jgi:hypothetical protein